MRDAGGRDWGRGSVDPLDDSPEEIAFGGEHILELRGTAQHIDDGVLEEVLKGFATVGPRGTALPPALL
jgi:hypothetical protein